MKLLTILIRIIFSGKKNQFNKTLMMMTMLYISCGVRFSRQKILSKPSSQYKLHDWYKRVPLRLVYFMHHNDVAFWLELLIHFCFGFILYPQRLFIENVHDAFYRITNAMNERVFFLLFFIIIMHVRFVSLGFPIWLLISLFHEFGICYMRENVHPSVFRDGSVYRARTFSSIQYYYFLFRTLFVHDFVFFFFPSAQIEIDSIKFHRYLISVFIRHNKIYE